MNVMIQNFPILCIYKYKSHKYVTAEYMLNSLCNIYIVSNKSKKDILFEQEIPMKSTPGKLMWNPSQWFW